MKDVYAIIPHQILYVSEGEPFKAPGHDEGAPARRYLPGLEANGHPFHAEQRKEAHRRQEEEREAAAAKRRQEQARQEAELERERAAAEAAAEAQRVVLNESSYEAYVDQQNTEIELLRSMYPDIVRGAACAAPVPHGC